jgi:hypothetical protein
VPDYLRLVASRGGKKLDAHIASTSEGENDEFKTREAAQSAFVRQFGSPQYWSGMLACDSFVTAVAVQAETI